MKRSSASPVVVPFTVLIDTREQTPWGFRGLRADADKDCRPLAIKTEFKCLGDGLGDYAIKELEGQIAIERKSMADGHGTILGWAPRGDSNSEDREEDRGRRERFKEELANLAKMEFAAVVVEASFGQFVKQAPEWGVKTAAENAKQLFRCVLSWQQRYRGVHWVFCDSRADAEVTAFRILERFWRSKYQRYSHKPLKGKV